jgi:hypothetical protein
VTLIFAVLATLVATGAVFLALDPLLRYARRPAANDFSVGPADGVVGRRAPEEGAAADAALLAEIEREVCAIRTHRRGAADTQRTPPRGRA